MIPELRQKFNSKFSQSRYDSFINDLNSTFGYKIDFRIAETPIFLPEHLNNELIKASNEIISFLQSDKYQKASMDAIPNDLRGAERRSNPINETHDLRGAERRGNPINDTDKTFPEMLALDFAVCKDDSGKLFPQLIELQGFPSLYCYQELLNQKYREHFDIDNNLKNFFNGLDHDSYVKLLREIIIGDSNPENVILLEIEPDKQKTRIDFSCTEKWLGIKPVCISEIIKEGKDLFYYSPLEKGGERSGGGCNSGRKTKIERIYNRVIFDELKKSPLLGGVPAGRGGSLNFSFHDDLNVKWIPHPNWFFRISKYSLPYLNPLPGFSPFEGGQGDGTPPLSKYVPSSAFLHDLTQYPSDLENYILKPLYSFAGSGVIYDVTKDELDSIPDKQNYILQKKINYEPIIQTPDIPAKAEIRLLCLFPPSGGPRGVVNNIVRLSKGKMMGVDFNKDKTWVGSSIAYFS